MLARLVLASTLTSRKDFFAGEVTDTFKGTSFGELTRDALVDAILDGIYVLVACDLGLVQFTWSLR
jgi:hypothetical protein